MAMSERLRIELNWPVSVRGQMMLGALAPDAHTETTSYDRTWLHPEPGTDVVSYVVDKIRPCKALAEAEGRAFAASIMAHILADEVGRPFPVKLPEHAPSGFVPVSEAAAHLQYQFSLPGMRRDLTEVEAVYGMAPLSADEIGRKRRAALSRPPMSDAAGPYVAVDEMARVIDDVVSETLRQIRAHRRAAELLNDAQ